MEENIKQTIDYAYDNNVAAMQASIEDAIKEKILSALDTKRIEVAQSLMQSTNEAYRPDPSDYVPDDNSEPDFKGHMDDHPNYKRVGGYGKYRAFGVHEYTGNTLGAVPYIASDANGDVIFKGDREGAHNAAKTAALKANPVKESHFEEKLVGKQHKLDKNKNGKLDSQDFKLIRKESEELEEKLSVSDGVSAWIKDFVHSDDPRFEGKSKEERRQMALGAYYAAKKGTNESSNIGWAKKKSMETDPVFRKKMLDAQAKRKERAEIARMPAKTSKTN